MKKHIIDLQKYVKENFIFYNPCVDILGNDIYFCRCGQKNIVNPNESSYAIQVEDINQIDSSHLESAFRKANIICPTCKANYTEPEVYTTIQNVETDFLDRYQIHEDDKSLTLYKYRVTTVYDKEKIEYNTNISESYITILKKTKKIKYKSQPNINKNVSDVIIRNNKLANQGLSLNKSIGNEEIKVELSNVIDVSKSFFSNGQNTQITEGFIHVHDFVGRLAKLIIDSKNMNLVEELMNQMVGKSGIKILQKILAIFMGILCYPNLSTIALTKGNTFLYELMESCPLPTIKYLKDNDATAPLKIFNTLVSLKNNDLQKKLDQDDIDKLGYVFKSASGKEFNIRYDISDIKKVDDAQAISTTGAKLFVRDTIANQKISPYIFNKIQKFSDYENVVQWLKFLSYNDLIKLVMEHDIELLNIVYKKIEFRDDINKDRIRQFISIMLSYAQIEMSKEYSVLKSRVLARGGEVNTNYEAAKYFDFNLYDDCMRMIMELNWSPNKALYKVKTFDKLGKLHHDLLKYRSFMSDKDANENYIIASSKFEYLEGNYKDKEGRFSFEVKLIKTPEELLNTAIEMHNCAGSYINKVAKGIYVPFVIYDNSSKRKEDEFHKYMMIVEVTKLGLEFVGVKSYCNQYGSDRFKSAIMAFLVEKDISFKEVPSIKLGIKSTEMSYVGTFEKVELLNNNEEIIDNFKGKFKK